jgi:rhodanese-related sulfurtransferase
MQHQVRLLFVRILVNKRLREYFEEPLIQCHFALRDIGLVDVYGTELIAGAIYMSVTTSVVNVRDVDPEEVWSALKSSPNAILVDVRTTAEWTYVGLPKLDTLSKRPVLLEWQTFPSMAINPAFVSTLQAALADAGLNSDTSLYFLCRSGVRSKAAAGAMIEAGWTNSFNIAGGFEGGTDAAGRRGAVNGWKACGLPWSQT